MLTSFSQTWALRRCCQETLSPIEISSSFPEKNLFELWNILLGQLRRALEEYLRIQRLVSPFFFFLLCSLSHYEQHGSHDGFCVFNLLAVSCSARFFPALFASAHYTNCNFRVWLFLLSLSLSWGWICAHQIFAIAWNENCTLFKRRCHLQRSTHWRHWHTNISLDFCQQFAR